MARTHTIGIDLGGTNIKAGVLDPAQTLVCRKSIATEADRGFEHVFARLVRLVDDLLEQAGLDREDVCAIGFGTPGPMSHEQGVIFAAPNLPGWENIPLRDRFAEATGLPVTLDNDANAAAFGEFTAGAGRGTRHMVMLTLGTGIGGGVIIDERLLRGAFDNAAEIGHTIAVPGGRPCPCGQRGCLERYASANAVAERLVEAIEAGEPSALADVRATGAKLTSADVARAAREGDALAARVWDETCRHLAVACVNIQHLVNPETIVLGGGLIGAGEQLLSPIREHFRKEVWPVPQDYPRIEFATLGDNAGIVGAAALARLDASRA